MEFPNTRKIVGGLETHYYTSAETFEDEVLASTISLFGEIQEIESPIVVLPDVSHKADRISPTGMALATKGSIIPAALPAANGSGVRVGLLDIAGADLNADTITDFLRLLAARIPIYGEDSPALIRGRLREDDLLEIYRGGVGFLVDRLGIADSLERIESEGCFPIALESSAEVRRTVPDYLFEQGLHNFGILESGNHFIEIQIVEELLAPELAAAVGLETGRVVVMIHDGSPASLVAQYFHPLRYPKRQASERFEADKRAYHGRFSDAVSGLMGAGSDPIDARFFEPSSPHYAIEDGTQAHERFMNLMGMACNFGLANRSYLQHRVEETIRDVMGDPGLSCQTLTDTLHDCVKRTRIAGQSYMVHRHGASEARPAGTYRSGHPFAQTGQLLAIPGAPGRSSFLAAAAETDRTWHTANHGAGRRIDRAVARGRFEEEASVAAVRDSGATLLRGGLANFSGEHPAAYKDGREVLDLAEGGRLLRGVARMRPVAIYKG